MKSSILKKYLFVFVITMFIFGTAIALSNYLNNKRVEQIQEIESKIAINTISLETQFDLLQQVPCTDAVERITLPTELNSLAAHLTTAENNLGINNPDVISLKRQYSLLEIKDYLLMQKIAAQCKLKTVFILYFYSNAGNCADCVKEGYVLTSLREQFPALRVYSFDYDLDLSALKTLEQIYKLNGTLPVLVINKKVKYGYQSMEDIIKLVPELQPKIIKAK
ncbi:MAG: hypothetical protein Q8L47_02135 [bacterium]|nr:hypothetical protein [bacterium]